MPILKKTIEKIHRDNTDYNNPSQVLNQANSLETLSSDLYTDATRFIYELLQNADDSSVNKQAVKVEIKLFNDTLVIVHSGNIFDNRDVEGICGVNNGTKKSAKEKTGYKGIGFKSVFGKSREVTIFSDNEYFKFDADYDFKWNSIWGANKEDWENENEREFKYPWQIIPISVDKSEINREIQEFITSNHWNVATIIKLTKKDNIIESIEELSNNVNMFLFLKNIDEITFKIDNESNITIDRTQANEITLKHNNECSSKWIINNIDLVVPEDLKQSLKRDSNIPEKLLEAENIELTLAIKEGKNGLEKLTENDSLLYSYLPTDEKRYTLPILVNTSFLTTANRESLHSDSLWNQWLFENISIELFKWIAKLVKMKYSYQAYTLIPNELSFNDDLAKSYNEGIKKAKEEIAFLLSDNNELLKIQEAMIDYTKFSKKDFIGSKHIKGFIEKEKRVILNDNPFIKNTKFKSKLKQLGVSTFEISNIPQFLKYQGFKDNHTIKNNIQLIKYFKKLADSEDQYITKTDIENWAFIYDHKNNLNYPNEIYIPTANDKNWNNQNSEFSFLHQDIQNLLLEDNKIKNWFEKIGVVEKTDISFLEKTIIPNADTYATVENTIATMQDIYKLYNKEIINKDLLNQLSELKLLTQNGSLLKASDCYFSDQYKPELKIEATFREDVFLDEKYLILDKNIGELKRFFKFVGVKEEIEFINFEEKIGQKILIDNYSFEEEYFGIFSSGYNHLPADEYKNISTLLFIKSTNNFSFSKLFWSNIIQNISLTFFIENVIAYWGYPGMPSRNSGSTMGNYLKWYIQNNKCIPTKQNKCKKSINVFLNTKEIVEICDNYLPVFEGDELSADWKSFFDFKTNMNLSDYLRLISNIMKDKTEDNKIKKKNVDRIQSIYKILLNQSENWNEEQIKEIKEWSSEEFLTNTDNKIVKCEELKYYIDGDSSMFQSMYQFINLNTENKSHNNIENFLSYFNIEILRQSDFKIIYQDKNQNMTLKNTLRAILPYLTNWLKKENISTENIKNKLIDLEVIEARNLELHFNDECIKKNILTHLENNILYVSTPWSKAKVFMTLPKVLCDYFDIKGNDKKIDFLLRAQNTDEIIEYFNDESIDIPKLRDINNEIGIIPLDIDDPVDNSINEELKIEVNLEAKKMAKESLSDMGYDNLVWDGEYSIVKGVKYEGKDVILVIKSAKLGYLYLNLIEWDLLSRSETHLIIIQNSEIEIIKENIKQKILQANEEVSVQFDIDDDVIGKIDELSKSLDYKKGAKYILKSPNFSYSKSLNEIDGHKNEGEVTRALEDEF